MSLARCLVLLTLALAPSATFAQAPKQKSAPQRKSFVLKGKVEEMNESGKVMTVNHQKVEGFMDAMTMPYKVDKPEVFKQVKVGDQIQATVYEGDYTLYEIKVVK